MYVVSPSNWLYIVSFAALSVWKIQDAPSFLFNLATWKDLMNSVKKPLLVAKDTGLDRGCSFTILHSAVYAITEIVAGSVRRH